MSGDEPPLFACGLHAAGEHTNVIDVRIAQNARRRAVDEFIILF